MTDLISDRQQIVADFHRLYYGSRDSTWLDTWWMGVRAQKCPLDLWVYQEIMHEVRPDLVVETGTYWGGSALFLASICDLLGSGRVISIDIEPQPGLPAHDRITYVTASSVSDQALGPVREAAAGAQSVLVILDSDHREPHVFEELRAYAPLVTPGSYIVVEDTNVNGNPVVPEFGPGPMEAMDRFLKETDDFEIDRSREKFFMTFNPRGFLRRVR